MYLLDSWHARLVEARTRDQQMCKTGNGGRSRANEHLKRKTVQTTARRRRAAVNRHICPMNKEYDFVRTDGKVFRKRCRVNTGVIEIRHATRLFFLNKGD